MIKTSAKKSQRAKKRLLNIYRHVLSLDLSNVEKLVLTFVLSKYEFKCIAFNKSKTSMPEIEHYVEISSRELSDHLGISIIQAKRVIKKLINNDMLDELMSRDSGCTKKHRLLYNSIGEVDSKDKFSLPCEISAIKELNVSDKFVYGRYYSFKNGKNASGHTIRRSEIANELNIDKRSVIRSIKKLNDLNLIETEKVNNKKIIYIKESEVTVKKL